MESKVERFRDRKEGEMAIGPNTIIGLINDFILTEDHKITVTGIFNDKEFGTMVEFNKEERGDIGRYLYHKPQAMIATIDNFDRLYYSNRVTS